MRSFDVIATQLTYEAAGVISLRIERLDGAPLPPWEPGAHVDVVLPVGITRQYSLIESPPDFSSYRVAVLQEPNSRGGSDYIHLFLRPGQPFRVNEPRNHFRFRDAPAYLLIAGGIGITPLVPMARAARAAGRRWTLHYGGRSRRTMAFWRALEAEHGDAVRLWPNDEGGRLPIEQLLAACEPGTLVYCCGPASLLEAVEQAAAALGWPADDVCFERFAPTEQEHGPDLPFTAVAARSGKEVAVAADESLLDALVGAGIAVSSSCRSGVCGACETRVLAGVPDHRDDILTASQRERGDVMMPCVSRALGERIVLDV